MTQNTAPDLSIVIPVHNTEQYLERCLISVATQTITNFEAICIDDASSDRSASILDSFAQKDDRFKVIRNAKNLGAGATRNIGIDTARGVYVTFLDSDDCLAPKALECLLERSESTEADICCSPLALDWPDKGVRQQCLLSLDPSLLPKGLQEPFSAAIAGDGAFMFTNPSVCTKLFRRSFLSRTESRFTDQRIAEDLLFTYAAFVQTDRIALSHECCYFYNQEKSTSVSKEPGNMTALVASMDMLYDKVNELGLLARYQSALMNLFLYHAGGTLTLIHDADSLQKAFNACATWKTRLRDANFDYLFPHYETTYRNLCFGSPTSYLLDMIETWKDVARQHEEQIASLTVSAESRARKCFQLQNELDEATSSRAFRLGSTLLYFPSKAKSTLKKLASGENRPTSSKESVVYPPKAPRA